MKTTQQIYHGWDFRINGEFVPGAEPWINLSFYLPEKVVNGVNHLRYEVDRLHASAGHRKISPKTYPSADIHLICFFRITSLAMKNVKVNLNFLVGTVLPYGPRSNNAESRNFFRLKPYHRIDVGFHSKKLERRVHQAKALPLPLRFAKSSRISLEAFNLLQISNQ